MPYCPKCDMEFVDGITVCSDCGGPLVESEEAYKKALKERQEMEKTQEMQKLLEAAAVCGRMQPQEETTEMPNETEEEAAADPRRRPRSAGVFISARQKGEDLRSSASAFLFVGIAITAFSALCWAGVIRLPMEDGSRIFFQSTLTFMGIFSLLVTVRTRRSLAAMAGKAEEEERLTAEITEWFLSKYKGEQLDRKLLSEDSSLSGAELELKRSQLILDLLITGRDLPEPAYADYLAEELYEKLYPDTEE